MTVYAIAIGNSPQSLQESVEGYLSQGFTTIGSLVINPVNGHLFQPMMLGYSGPLSAQDYISLLQSLPVQDPNDGISLWNNAGIITMSLKK